MNTRKVLIISIIIVIIAILSYATYLLITNKKTGVCQDLGCPEGTVYVGSINSDKYYICDCHYAKRINPENIICFTSDEEAQSKNYTKVEC